MAVPTCNTTPLGRLLRHAGATTLIGLMPQRFPSADSPLGQASGSDQLPSERATKMRLLVLVMLILGIAAMITWRTSPDDRAIDITVKSAMDAMQEKQKEAETKAVAMSRGRAFDFASATSPEELDRRITLTVEAARVNDQLLALGNGAGEKIGSDLRSQKVSAAKVAKAVAVFNEQVWPNRKTMFTESGKMYAAGEDLLRYLRDHWGHWKYDAQRRAFDPETPEIDKAIADRQVVLQDALRAQKAAMGW